MESLEEILKGSVKKTFALSEENLDTFLEKYLEKPLEE